MRDFLVTQLEIQKTKLHLQKVTFEFQFAKPQNQQRRKLFIPNINLKLNLNKLLCILANFRFVSEAEDLEINLGQSGDEEDYDQDFSEILQIEPQNNQADEENMRMQTDERNDSIAGSSSNNVSVDELTETWVHFKNIYYRCLNPKRLEQCETYLRIVWFAYFERIRGEVSFIVVELISFN